MIRDEFETAMLAEVRRRLGRRPFLTRLVSVDSVELARTEATTDVVVRFALSGEAAGRYGWRATVWPAPDLPAVAVAQHVVSSLVERLESRGADLDGVPEGGVQWLTTSPRI